MIYLYIHIGWYATLPIRKFDHPRAGDPPLLSSNFLSKSPSSTEAAKSSLLWNLTFPCSISLGFGIEYLDVV